MKHYLLHGDQTDVDKFYCMRCDMSFEAAHFVDGHADGLLVQCEKYHQSKKILKDRLRLFPSSKGLFRPNDVFNLFTGERR